MNDAKAIEYARLAMQEWRVTDAAPRLIKNRENAVFEVLSPQGERAALRLHRPGYQSDNAIRSELVWSNGLADAGMVVPRPIPTRTGDVIAKVPAAGRVASLVSWMEGVPLGDGGVPFDWSEDQQADLYFALGEELAKLHRISDDLVFDRNFERPCLDVDGLLGEHPLWGQFWKNPALDIKGVELVKQARSRLVQVLQTVPKTDGQFGLIHADALRENVLVQNGTVRLIDFDDGVYGFRLYELGVAMSQNWHLPNAPSLARALCDGYQLPSEYARFLPDFTVMRALASCGWAISRYEKHDPALKSYAARAVEISKRYLHGPQLFP